MLYLPVLHAGYERLVAKYANAEILLLGTGFAERYPVVRKGFRALDPQRAAEYLRAVDPALAVSVVEPADLPERVRGHRLFAPEESLMREVADDFGLDGVTFDDVGLLRWDRARSNRASDPVATATVTRDELARAFLTRAAELGSTSPDWWRQVGAIAARGGRVLAQANNAHLPSEYELYAHGDPRDSYRRAQRLDLTTALHAEAAVVGQAARTGTSLLGADLYVSTFPCPTCARLVVASGFARCFFAEGYSLLDGDVLLREAGVAVIAVDLSPRAAS